MLDTLLRGNTRDNNFSALKRCQIVAIIVACVPSSAEIQDNFLTHHLGVGSGIRAGRCSRKTTGSCLYMSP